MVSKQKAAVMKSSIETALKAKQDAVAREAAEKAARDAVEAERVRREAEPRGFLGRFL